MPLAGFRASIKITDRSVIAFLALVSWPSSRDKSCVKYCFASLILMFCSLSCTPIHEHKAGGGAYDDSALGPVLDANGPLPGEDYSEPRSFEEWKSQG